MSPKPIANKKYDAVVIGAGHNGLVAATLLQRRGMEVLVFEEKAAVGGACKTEYPFKKAPTAPSSTGAYLLGPMPPEILAELDIHLPLKRRDPHYFLPTTDNRYLLFGSDHAALEAQFKRFFSESDWHSYCQMNEEITALRDDIAPSWLQPPLSIEATAERFVRKQLREVFVQLCRGSIGDYLARFEFKSELLPAMFAVTDGFSGLLAAPSTPGTGMNFLVHNMCRLPGADGTWMRVEGGMGTVTKALADAFLASGGKIQTNAKVEQIVIRDGQVLAVQAEGLELVRADIVIANADPYRLFKTLDQQTLNTEFQDYQTAIEKLRAPGSTLKVNLCLKGKPRFRCLESDLGQLRGTVHLIAESKSPLEELEKQYQVARAGKLPRQPAIEWYFDESLKDENGNFSSALFVPGMPFELAQGTWDTVEETYTDELLTICETFAPGTKDLVVDRFILTPPGIERHFGISGGQIHHVPNVYGCDDRVSYETPIGGLYMASSACHPAGSVIGAAGYICAKLILAAD